tara:strand:- start:723 stop:2345 length:1623 start_codon:yes stop_codon:yes gene_type:complete
MAKLLKLRRGTTSQHSSFTGAEGEVTVDTDKETLVIHDGSTAGGHPVAAEDMANVSSSTIAGRLSNDSIATSKIAGGALPTDVTVASANIVNGTIVSADIADGTIATADIANSAINADKLDNAAVTFAKMQNISQNSLLARLSSGSGSVQELSASQVRGILNVENGATADQTKSDIDSLNINADQLDGQHGSYYQNASNLNAGTISASRVPTLNQNTTGSSASCTGNAATASNAALLDNIDSSQFVRSDANDTLTGTYTFAGSPDEKIVLNGTDPYLRFQEGGTNKAYIQWENSGYLQLVNQESSEVLRIKSGSNGLTFTEGGNERTVWHSGNDGSGSGLDADTLDGVSSGSFLRSDTADSASGDITFSGGAGAITISGSSDIRLSNGNWSGDTCKLQHHDNYLYIVGGSNGHILRDTSGHNNLIINSSGDGTFIGNVTAYSDQRLKTDVHTINDALGICGKLRGVSYKWIRNGKPSIGVIAQEIEEVIPEVVLSNHDLDPTTGESIEVKSVDYGKIVGVLINAINELKAELDEHKKGGE